MMRSNGLPDVAGTRAVLPARGQGSPITQERDLMSR